MKAISPAKTPTFPLIVRLAVLVVAVIYDVSIGSASGSQQGDFGRTVQLPPLLVMDTSWHYVSVPGLEVISRCSVHLTNEFVRAYLLRQMELEVILPPSLQFQSAQPPTMILITPQMGKAMNKAIADLMLRPEEGNDPLTKGVPIEPIPQVDLWDAEREMTTIELDTEYNFVFTLHHTGMLLEKRTPPLPYWFKEGIFTISQKISWTNPVRIAFPKYPFSRSANSLVPIEKVLTASDDVAEGDKLFFERWRLQVMLFMRWAFDDPSLGRRQALWKFVELSSSEPATEELFRQCFGMGYSEMDINLKKYLRDLDDQFPVYLIYPRTMKLPEFTLRDANPVVLARIQADFALKEAAFVGKKSPYIQKYMEKAETTLLRYFQSGTRDPSLVSVLGLYYAEMHDDKRARPLLEEGAAAQVSRPSVYFTLGRILYRQYLDDRDSEILTVAESTRILSTLKTGSRYQPPQIETYKLALDVWDHTSMTPSSEDLAFLKNGVTLFPGDEGLAAEVAALREHAAPKDDVLRGPTIGRVNEP